MPAHHSVNKSQLNAQEEAARGNGKHGSLHPEMNSDYKNLLITEMKLTIVMAIQQKLIPQCSNISVLERRTNGLSLESVMDKLWMTDTRIHGPLANMLLNTATYDAMLQHGIQNMPSTVHVYYCTDV